MTFHKVLPEQWQTIKIYAQGRRPSYSLGISCELAKTLLWLNQSNWAASSESTHFFKEKAYWFAGLKRLNNKPSRLDWTQTRIDGCTFLSDFSLLVNTCKVVFLWPLSSVWPYVYFLASVGRHQLSVRQCQFWFWSMWYESCEGYVLVLSSVLPMLLGTYIIFSVTDECQDSLYPTNVKEDVVFWRWLQQWNRMIFHSRQLGYSDSFALLGKVRFIASWLS